MPADAFDILILIARPAAGKSETLHYLHSVPTAERIRRFHIAEMVEIDDFPMLWAWFEEDDLLQRMGLPRLYSNEDHYFRRNEYWHLLIRRLGLEYDKALRRRTDLHVDTTALIEFSRGAASGGYREAFQHLPEGLLRRAAVLYIEVSYEESLRKNRSRFRPEEADSILYHGLPDSKMETLYQDDDFRGFSAADPRWLSVKGIQIPYATFDNEDDVTSGPPEALGARLERVLGELWAIHLARLAAGA